MFGCFQPAKPMLRCERWTEVPDILKHAGCSLAEGFGESSLVECGGWKPFFEKQCIT